MEFRAKFNDSTPLQSPCGPRIYSIFTLTEQFAVGIVKVLLNKE